MLPLPDGGIKNGEKEYSLLYVECSLQHIYLFNFCFVLSCEIQTHPIPRLRETNVMYFVV